MTGLKSSVAQKGKYVTQIIHFVGKIVEWFISSIISKGFRILEASITPPDAAPAPIMV